MIVLQGFSTCSDFIDGALIKWHSLYICYFQIHQIKVDLNDTSTIIELLAMVGNIQAQDIIAFAHDQNICLDLDLSKFQQRGMWNSVFKIFGYSCTQGIL